MNRFLAAYSHLFTITYSLFTDMEVRGVEPLSEMASPERLRVYLAFDLGRSTPAKRAYPHPSVRFGTLQRPSGEPCSVICYIMPRRSADIGASTCGHYLGGKSVIVVGNYFFPSFFTWPTRIHDARSDLGISRRNRITPIKGKNQGKLYHRNPKASTTM